jgi:hypothetical protein
MMLAKSGESGEPCGVPSRTGLLDPVHHDPGFHIPADKTEKAFVGHLSRHPCHQRVVLYAVKEPLEIDIDHPIQARDHVATRHLHRLLGVASRSEAVAPFREVWVEYRRQGLRDCLLDEPVQHRRHS